MSIRFAAAAKPTSVRMSPDRVRAIHTDAANDDGDLVSQVFINAALRHFATHGLGAAQHARDQALAASEAGDRQTFEWWLEICRALDRRMARRIDPKNHANSAR
ncbi:hypothetical protein [Erythrobacter alti]|uniref:hypothetical protein n=1 Tax=Erythrobacter alti TaxID=1896145 RepID=UPI0030F4B074